jgi:hypothetical protein
MNGPSLFDQARGAAKIADVCGVKLKRAGREMRGACPICGGGGKSKSAPFAVKIATDTFRTYCGGGHVERGDVVDLVAAMRGETLVEAARYLIGSSGGPVVARSKPKVEKPQGPTSAQRIGSEMWATAKPLIGSLGERYLLGRGILPEVVTEAAPQLRYHPFAKAGWDDVAGDWIKAPAILVQVVTHAGPTGGVHATYLLRDGTARNKALGKKMWGPQGLDLPPDDDGVVRRLTGGAWLIGPEGEGDPAGGEGLETSLSVVSLARLKGRRLRCWAALSLDRLQGGVLVDDDGCQDIADPKPDPERPPFVWPSPPASPWSEAIIALDMDMKPVRLKGRSRWKRPTWFTLDAEARAQRCGRLAVKGWLAVGAPRAVALAAPPGLDFNDHLRRVLASRAGPKSEGVA